MSKHLNVTTGDYIVTVENGGDIVLNTGDLSQGSVGDVRITGNLYVDGTTTTVNSQDLAVEDNIIVLNKNGTDNNGILPNPSGQRISGIEIDRGTAFPRARLVFDENLDALYPDGNARSGAWSYRDDDNNRNAIEAVSITTPSTDLVLLGISSLDGQANPGVVTVDGTNTAPTGQNSYSQRIRDIEAYGPNIVNPAADIIPNVFYVVEKIVELIQSVDIDRIQEGTFAGDETTIEVFDDTVTGNPSKAEIIIDGVTRVTFFENNTEIHGINITNNVIESIANNQDLVLTANGNGRVAVKDGLLLTKTPHNNTVIEDPAAPTDGSLLYSKTADTGETGVYFVNESGVRDELISKNRALVYSMLF